MAKRLSAEEIHARCEAYDQAIGSLTIGRWTEDPEELLQANIVVRQIESLRDRIAEKLPQSTT